MSVVVLQVASWSRLTSNPTVPADCSNRTTRTELRPARAESLHVAEGHRSSLFEEGHNQQERHHIEELAVDSLAVDHILATDRRVGKEAEEWSNSEGTDCRDLT